MIFNKYPFDRNGGANHKNLSKETLKFSSKVIITEELKEVLKSLLCKKPEERLSISKIFRMPWFEFSEEELQKKVKEIQDQEDEKRKRKEYLARKAALRGNKFLNDAGEVVVMNRNMNKDLRGDLLYKEYSSDEDMQDDEKPYHYTSPKFSSSFKNKLRDTSLQVGSNYKNRREKSS